MTHRADVQILRGIAVLLVVLFHLGLTDFGSGFLGVDVFFVISGYLMARMYEPQQAATFFRRRAWRLLPAYVATVVATLVATAIIATPNEVAQVASQAWQALTFTSNFWFWFGESYWDKKEFRPLLHLWSLAVEIQFYVLVPFISLYARRFRLGGVVMLALLSALLCFAIVATSPKTSFFWLPTRMWEFLLGFGLALALGKRTIGHPAAPWVGVLGCLVIALIPLIPINGEALGFVHGHPGLTALAITVATATVLACGLPAGLQAAAPMRGLAKLGDWSYSVYLAHFPAIVLYLYQPFGGTNTHPASVRELVLATVAVIITSALLYRGVERPLRHGVPSRPLLATALLAVLAVTAATPWLKNATLSESEQIIFAARHDRGPFRCGKSWRALHPSADTCPLNDPSPRLARAFLVGNSHADSLKEVLAELATARGVQIYLTVENYPLMPIGVLRPDDIVARALAQGSTAIILHYSAGAVTPAVISELAESAARHGISTQLVMPVPLPVDNVPRLMWEASRSGQPAPLSTLTDYRNKVAAFEAGLDGITTPRFHRYEVAEVYCRPDCAISGAGGRLYYYDTDHMTRTGTRQMHEVLERLLSEVLAEIKAPAPPDGPR